MGADRVRTSDAWVIAATRRPLRDCVADGSFRSDLRFRLEVFTVVLPPLRDRPASILPLAERFLGEVGAPRSSLDAEARDALLAHDWPGNVRELRHRIEAATVYAGGGPIGPEHLDLPVAPPPTGEAGLEPPSLGNLLGTLARREGWCLPELIARCEAAVAAHVLAEQAGSRSRAAAELGVHPRTLARVLNRAAGRLGAPAAPPDRTDLSDRSVHPDRSVRVAVSATH